MKGQLLLFSNEEIIYYSQAAAVLFARPYRGYSFYCEVQNKNNIDSIIFLLAPVEIVEPPAPT